jgi:PST family polysaccharide transporter
LGQIIEIISKFTLGVLLARILGPVAFGLVGMVTVFSGFASILVDFGFGSALIQDDKASQNDFSTIFWLNLIISFTIYIIFFVSSPLIASFYSQPELELLTKIITLKFLISAFYLVQKIRILKRVDFKVLTIISTTANLLSLILAIVLAYEGFAVWAVVYQMLFQSIIELLCFCIYEKWIPSFLIRKSSIRKYIKFGLNVTGDSVLNYFSRNYDNLLVGKILGEQSLGIYSRAFSLVLFPIRNFSQVIKKVLFPSFSLYRSDKNLIKVYYLKVTQLISFFTIPLMGFLVIEADKIVLIFLGAEWIEMIPIIRIFSFISIFQAILTVNGTIYLALNHTDIALRVGFWAKLRTVFAITVGIYLGDLTGVAIGLLVAQLINFYPIFISAARLIDLTLLEQIKNLKSVFIANSLAFSLSLLIHFITDKELVFLIINSVIFFAIYLLMAYKLNVEALNLVIQRIKKLK